MWSAQAPCLGRWWQALAKPLPSCRAACAASVTPQGCTRCGYPACAWHARGVCRAAWLSETRSGCHRLGSAGTHCSCQASDLQHASAQPGTDAPALMLPVTCRLPRILACCPSWKVCVLICTM